MLIESSQLRAEMGQRARQRYVEDFQFEQMLARTLQVYEQLIEKRGTSAENIRAKLGSSES